MNELVFKDIIAEGRRKLEKKNLDVVRYRRFEREKRKRKLDDEVYDEISEFWKVGMRVSRMKSSFEN